MGRCSRPVGRPSQGVHEGSLTSVVGEVEPFVCQGDVIDDGVMALFVPV
jgi:hypothetical protein